MSIKKGVYQRKRPPREQFLKVSEQTESKKEISILGIVRKIEVKRKSSRVGLAAGNEI